MMDDNSTDRCMEGRLRRFVWGPTRSTPGGVGGLGFKAPRGFLGGPRSSLEVLGGPRELRELLGALIDPKSNQIQQKSSKIPSKSDQNQARIKSKSKSKSNQNQNLNQIKI